MDQDPTFELLGLRRWVEAGLLDEFSAEPVVGAERGGDTIGSVEREHERPPEELAVWMLCHQLLEIGYDLAVVADVEFGLDQALDGQQAQLGQPH